MNASIRKRYLAVAKELRTNMDSEEFRVYGPETAFTHWYIKARFGATATSQKIISDGKSDGGIDAIVYENSSPTVFQMKYETVPRITSVKSEELSEFEKLAKIFKEKGTKEQFTDWITNVRPNLRGHYEKLYAFTQKNPDQVSFVFVTTKHTTLSSETIKIEDMKRVLSLWDLYREGFTPPTDSINLTLDQPFNVASKDGDFTTYVGLADVRDFISLMREDSNERLFAQNVRTDRASTINAEIRKTYEKDPHSFWLGNNGIYIVCKQVSSSGRKFNLVYPSIINGSQTLHSIKKSNVSHECKILVRILEMDVLGNQRLLGEVIRRTNTQNPMKAVNLLAHDPFQLNIARYLDRYKIFYERREGEWKNEKQMVMSGYITVAVQELAQWLSTLDTAIGMGRARSRTGDLFQEEYRKRIFEDFDRNLSHKSYKDLTSIVWSGLFIKELVKDLPKKQRAFAKIPQLLLIKGLFEAATQNSDSLKEVRDCLARHAFGKRNLPKPLMQYFRATIQELMSIQKKYQHSHPLTDYSNYFKIDKLTLQAYSAVFTNAKISKLSRILKKSATEIV